MKNNIKILTVFSIIHFIVDFSCIYIIYNLFLDNTVDYKLKITMLIIYNFFAFFMQAPFGIIIDKLGGSFKYSALGCIFIFLSIFFVKYKLISVMIIGIGNALFHLGGGVEILNRSEKKATMPGIFVSTGALGLFLGSVWANVRSVGGEQSTGLFSACGARLPVWANVKNVGANVYGALNYIVYIILIASAATLFFVGANAKDVGANEEQVGANVYGARTAVGANEEQVGANACGARNHVGANENPVGANACGARTNVGANAKDVGANVYGARTAVGANEKNVGGEQSSGLFSVYGAHICVIILITCIIIRSFVGMISIFPWKKIFIYSLFLTLATVFGKFFGGIISDKFTAKKTTFISLFLSSILYIFAEKSALAGIISTFLFNMTMPITLIYISNILEEKKGFAFGLTTLGLFLGYLPVVINLIDANIFMRYIPFFVMLQNILLVSIITLIDKKNPAIS